MTSFRGTAVLSKRYDSYKLLDFPSKLKHANVVSAHLKFSLESEFYISGIGMVYYSILDVLRTNVRYVDIHAIFKLLRLLFVS